MNRDEIIMNNIPLVNSIAKKYVGKGLELEDLIQEGIIGLMTAYDKYDNKYDVKFSTYATYWVRQSISRAVADKGRSIRIPVYMTEIINKINERKKSLTVELNREVNAYDLAKDLELPLDRVIEALELSNEILSINITTDTEDEFGDTIQSNDEPLDELMARNDLINRLGDKLSILNPRECCIISMRYGLNDGKIYTHEEIGEIYNISKQRVSQIEKRALEKLKEVL